MRTVSLLIGIKSRGVVFILAPLFNSTKLTPSQQVGLELDILTYTTLERTAIDIIAV